MCVSNNPKPPKKKIKKSKIPGTVLSWPPPKRVHSLHDSLDGVKFRSLKHGSFWEYGDCESDAALRPDALASRETGRDD